MSCCGTRMKVRKPVINSEIKQQLPRQQTNDQDIIQLPFEQRKLFRCPFNISQMINPQHMLVATVDYSMMTVGNRQELRDKVSPLMMRQQPGPIRQSEVRFELRQKERPQMRRSDSEKQEEDENQNKQRRVDLKVIDQYKKENKPHERQTQKPIKMEMMAA